MSEKLPRKSINVLLLATLALSGCTPPNHHTPQSTTSGTTAAASGGSTAPAIKSPELPLPTPNPESNRGKLISCFVGGVALPPHVPLRNDERITDAETATTVHMPSDLQARVHAASVKVQVREARELYETTGTTVLNGPNGALVGGVAHAVFGTRNPQDITVIDANGVSHHPDAGCYVYDVNGQAAPLDVHATEPSNNVDDDLLILHIPESMPGALPIADTPPAYATPLFAGMYPLQNGRQGTETYSDACLNVFQRDNTFSAACASRQQPGEGDSGSSMVTLTGSVAGIYNGFQHPSKETWGTDGNVFGEVAYFQLDYTGLPLLDTAVSAAEEQYAR